MPRLRRRRPPPLPPRPAAQGLARWTLGLAVASLAVGGCLSDLNSEFRGHALTDREYVSSLAGEMTVFLTILHPEELKYTYKLTDSLFAPPFNASTGKSPGYLVLSDPPCGCGPLRNPDEAEGNVVLVERGDCSFVTKVVRAQEAGASGVIVADNDSGNDVLHVTMAKDETNRHVTIPAAFLLGKDGYHIRRVMEQKRLDRAVIEIPVNITNKAILDLNHPPWIIW